MKKRFFSKRQKRIMKLMSGNLCENCGVELKGKFNENYKKETVTMTKKKNKKKK